MAKTESFDVTTGVDLQEVDNAVNQASKEIAQRYDFKNLKVEIELDRKENKIRIDAPDSYKLEAIWEVLISKLVKRAVPTKNMHRGKIEEGTQGRARQIVDLVQGIEQEIAKKIVKVVKDSPLKKVQASIQGDQVRIAGPSRDDLQEAMNLLRGEDFGIELKFGNYR